MEYEAESEYVQHNELGNKYRCKLMESGMKTHNLRVPLIS